jgi:hypothetical protein
MIYFTFTFSLFIYGAEMNKIMEKESNTDRQMAAQCTARLFQGMGHKIRLKQSGFAHQEEGADIFTETEKGLLQEAFDFFLALIRG